MSFWQKQATGNGWTSVVFGPGYIAVAEVERRMDAQPKVHACESFARSGNDIDALKRLRNAKRIARTRCTTVLAHGQYQLLQVEVPENSRGMARDELRESLRWRVKEMVDFPVDTARIDILDIPQPGGRSMQLWVVLAGRQTLEPRVHAFQDTRTPLNAIDIPELAQRNLATLFEEPHRALALVAFDNRGGRLTVTHEGNLYMTRHIDVGGNELAGPNAAALHERALLDIQRTLDNFDRNYSALPLTRLLVGPLPGGQAFIEYLRNNLSLPVMQANLAEVLDITATPRLAEASAQADCWLALGAALREQ